MWTYNGQTFESLDAVIAHIAGRFPDALTVREVDLIFVHEDRGNGYLGKVIVTFDINFPNRIVLPSIRI